MVPTTMQGKFVLRFSVNYEYQTQQAIGKSGHICYKLLQHFIPLLDDAWKVVSSSYVTSTLCKVDMRRRSGEGYINPDMAYIIPISEANYRKRLAK